MVCIFMYVIMCSDGYVIHMPIAYHLSLYVGFTTAVSICLGKLIIV